VPGIVWLKVTDPGELPLVSPDTDLRVLLPGTDEFAMCAEELSAAGAPLRQVRYLLNKPPELPQTQPPVATRERQVRRKCYPQTVM
jgi:hypothetical protein